ncbi:lymphocyte antigen 6 complex locus protein G5c [Orycteropus afer afer]|uniref:Lymphocyte antigen 6 complex locus protein G5c n=1 Tax=Orycteropus afer afer TaxID=1230840 RepID=A0A8B7ANR3_ORYAF|nr:lymphocyte antigen 6 complex locus protein G5c [Orycteropus afer afer]
MHLMAGPASRRSLGLLGLHSTSQTLCMVLLLVLVMKSLVFGNFAVVNWEPPPPPQLPKYLRCYRCLFETKELGCLLGSDTCLAPRGSSCITLHIKNSSSTDIMVSDCRRKEQMNDCSYTRTSPVFGFWIYSRCCFLDFCNDPHSRAIYNP